MCKAIFNYIQGVSYCGKALETDKKSNSFKITKIFWGEETNKDCFLGEINYHGLVFRRQFWKKWQSSLGQAEPDIL